MHDGIDVFRTHHAPRRNHHRADSFASFTFFLAFLAVIAWLGLGSVPATTAETLALAVLAAATVMSAFVCLWHHFRMATEERRIDWMPLAAGLSSLMVGIVLFTFYWAGAGWSG